jgi:exonuclease I
MSQLYLAFDTETGGLSPEDADLLTGYFAILDEEYNIVEELNLKFKPNNGRLPIAEAQALKINGIDIKAHLADPETISYDDGKEKLINMLQKYYEKKGKNSNIRPMGYNILGFDIAWVQKYLMTHSEWNHLLHYKSVDTMQAVDFLKRMGWFPPELGSLNTVVEYLNLPKLPAHDARNDVLMTISVEKKLKELMRAKKDGGQVVDLIALLESE